ncbi:MAG: CocE/NonD family hydrolase [Chloroflexota bacterium]
MPESRPEYGIVIAKDVMVPMRDGVRLATDVYYPARDGAPAPGAFPAILGRTSYDKNSPQMWVEPVGGFFCRRGYVVVIQDLRGRHHSEGTGQYYHTANPTEGPDGYDSIEWIAAQRWSNGKVGMVGSSHGAIVQQIAALYRPPHLAAIWPDVGPTNIYDHEARGGGAMQLQMFGAQFLHAHDAQEIRDDPAAKALIFQAMADARLWVERTPFKPGHTPLRVVPNLEKTLFDYYYRGAYDEFWGQDCCDQTAYFDRHADVPGVYSGGWYDPFAVATTGYFAAMAKQNRTPQRLLMGPWNHGAMRGPGATWVGDVDFGPAARWGDEVYNQERLRWFDRWLKDVPNGVEDDPPVRIFVMGGGSGRKTREGRLDHGGQWRSERAWPLAHTRFTPYYLHADGSLAPTSPADDPAPVRFSFDPAHPVPTIGGAVTGFYELVPIGEGMNPAYVVPRARMRSIVLDGGAHQKEEPGIIGARPPYPALAVRPDVLAFQTLPLADAIEVTGSVVVNLWISSSAVDTDVTAKLLDVYPPNEDYPDGYHLNLVDFILRLRYREGWDREVLLTPGEIYPVRIALPPTSNLFAAGHRIRFDVSSSNFPRFDVNPNTGEPVGRHTHRVIAHNAIYCDPAHPSHVVLPMVG